MIQGRRDVTMSAAAGGDGLSSLCHMSGPPLKLRGRLSATEKRSAGY